MNYFKLLAVLFVFAGCSNIRLQGIGKQEAKDSVSKTKKFLNATLPVAKEEWTCALPDPSLPAFTRNSLACFGKNSEGQLGENVTTNFSNTPVVRGGFTAFKSFDIGSDFGCVLTLKNEIFCWGNNAFSQIGNAFLASSPSPLIVRDPSIKLLINTLSLGATHACATDEDGYLYCWGENAFGQIGFNDSKTIFKPTPVSSITLAVKSVVTSRFSDLSGNQYTCVILVSEDVYCFGSNESGRLGDNSNINRSTPLKVSGLTQANNKIVISAGTTCVLTGDSTVQCWGRNDKGQLANATTNPSFVPITVSSLANITSLEAGENHFCAITTQRKLLCWGDNTFGQIGSNTLSQPFYSTPQEVNLPNVKAISLSATGTCAVVIEGGVFCWGKGNEGLMGNGSDGEKNPSPLATSMTEAVSHIALSASGTACAFTINYKFYCWGNNKNGELGVNRTDISYSNNPLQVNAIPIQMEKIIPGHASFCAQLVSGSALCWGKNSFNLLYGNDAPQKSYPFPLSSPYFHPKLWQVIKAGGSHACVQNSSGTVECWGRNDFGQLGDGTTNHRIYPQSPFTNAHIIKDVALGVFHSCFLDFNKKMYCTGRNSFGQIGNNSMIDQKQSVQVFDNVAMMSLGENHTCAVKVNDELYCWGDNSFGQLGINKQVLLMSSLPGSKIEISGETIKSVSAGKNHTCALTALGKIYCWGDNSYGQLGVNSIFPTSVPAYVNADGVIFSSVSSGSSHTCAGTVDKLVYCWGSNNKGQLGNKTLSQSLIPKAVVSF